MNLRMGTGDSSHFLKGGQSSQAVRVPPVFALIKSHDHSDDRKIVSNAGRMSISTGS